jgi:hypothetical protein
MAQQTAVEWLQEVIINHLSHEQQIQLEGLFQQAKHIEKEQIMKTWYDCKYITIIDKIPMDAEEYYNETYESK